MILMPYCTIIVPYRTLGIRAGLLHCNGRDVKYASHLYPARRQSNGSVAQIQQFLLLYIYHSANLTD